MTNHTKGYEPNFPFKLAGIDLDGTLLDAEKRISAENAEAVQELVGRGVMVVLTTGRLYQHTTPYYNKLGLTAPVVTSDGSSVRIPFRRTLREIPLPGEIGMDILRTAEDFKITALSFLRQGIRVTSMNDWNDDMDRHRRELPHYYRQSAVKKLTGHRLQKILLFCPDGERLAAFERTVDVAHAASVNTIRNSWTIEYTASGVDKVSGLETVCAAYNIAQSEILFFGDGNNDARALGWAGCGIAMHHGSNAARLSAKHVAPETDPAINLAAAISMVL